MMENAILQITFPKLFFGFCDQFHNGITNNHFFLNGE